MLLVGGVVFPELLVLLLPVVMLPPVAIPPSNIMVFKLDEDVDEATECCLLSGPGGGAVTILPPSTTPGWAVFGMELWCDLGVRLVLVDDMSLVFDVVVLNDEDIEALEVEGTLGKVGTFCVENISF